MSLLVRINEEQKSETKTKENMHI